ncbi:hypothetical protein SPRG_08200 [Saprolegnia parasitica CBS 223.65]|uniref:FYVE-type domain-containing protein n=1 Tax=Saprolegnia parasitica (strain CBS 223.65) TaxID=695850 RepID=A0A067CHV7_SAPPC|nr:hypothetical protein SPRG_08200 [Saprolegnia parasitica CBS 223.65]KDO26397.1 hypothetical protein SPRG_08200 [Saprolegnia parasitica CBS 223.65]|eukprot:XP_012202835.1 hypothetical protein SPRG_08200 [Saprolegnia parasitica CBS 223.65]
MGSSRSSRTSLLGLGKHGRLPSPSCPALTPSQVRALKETAVKTCTELLSLSKLAKRNKYGITWRPLPFATDPGLAFFVGESAATSDVQYMCCATTVHATLDEVAELLSGDEQSAMGEEAYAQLEQNTVVSKNLRTLKHVDRLQISLRWLVWDSTSAYVPRRDFVVLQYQNDVHFHGRNGWAQSMHSVELPEFPAYHTSHSLVRGSLYRSGYVVLETATPGVVQVLHMVQVHFKGLVPSEDVESMLRARVGNIAHLSAFFAKLTLVARIVSNMETSRASNLEKVKVCAMCSRKFSFVHRKVTCRLCRDIVCTECSQAKDMQIPIAGLKRVDVCNVCNLQKDRRSDEHPLRLANRRSFLRQTDTHHRGSHRQSSRQHETSTDEDLDPYMQIMRGKQPQRLSVDAGREPLYSFLEDSGASGTGKRYAAISPVVSNDSAVVGPAWDVAAPSESSFQSRASAASVSADDFWTKPKHTL